MIPRRHRVPLLAETGESFSLPLGGVILGGDERHRPVPIRLFGPRSIRCFLLTSGYVARLLAVRGLNAGARVQVRTPRPLGWAALAAAAPELVSVSSPQSAAPPATPTFATAGAAGAPLLHCAESGLQTAIDTTELGPWQSTVQVHDTVTSSGATAVAGFDLVILQRLRPDLLDVLHAVLHFPDPLLAVLTELPDEVVAVHQQAGTRLVNLSPTLLEHELLGAPTRIDG